MQATSSGRLQEPPGARAPAVASVGRESAGLLVPETRPTACDLLIRPGTTTPARSSGPSPPRTSSNDSDDFFIESTARDTRWWRQTPPGERRAFAEPV